MREWRERVARAMWAASGEKPEHWDNTPIAMHGYHQRYKEQLMTQADAAIAELLPLVKAELAKVAQDEMNRQRIHHPIHPPFVIAAIEAWEPQDD